MRKTVLVLLFCVGAVCASAQGSRTTGRSSGGISATSSGNVGGYGRTDVAPRQGRWEGTGIFGFDFDESHIQVALSPQAGYAFTEFFVAGAGLIYNYYNNSRYEYTTHSIGANVFAKAYLLRYITLHLQPEVITTWRNPALPSTPRITSCSVLVGVGLTFPVSRGSCLVLMLYYDILQERNSLYGDRIFYSVGYNFIF